MASRRRRGQLGLGVAVGVEHLAQLGRQLGEGHGGAGDGVERVVDLVRHPCHELADGGQPLALDERRLGALELRERVGELGGARLDVGLQPGALLLQLGDGAGEALAHALHALAQRHDLGGAGQARHRGRQLAVGDAVGRRASWAIGRERSRAARATTPPTASTSAANAATSAETALKSSRGVIATPSDAVEADRREQRERAGEQQRQPEVAQHAAAQRDRLGLRIGRRPGAQPLHRGRDVVAVEGALVEGDAPREERAERELEDGVPRRPRRRPRPRAEDARRGAAQPRDEVELGEHARQRQRLRQGARRAARGPRPAPRRARAARRPWRAAPPA